MTFSKKILTFFRFLQNGSTMTVLGCLQVQAVEADWAD